MTTPPHIEVLVAGAPSMAAALEASGRFARVLHASTTSELRQIISTMGGVDPSRFAFLFADNTVSDTPGADVSTILARLTTAGWKVGVLEVAGTAHSMVSTNPGAGLIPGPFTTNNTIGAVSGMLQMLVEPVAEQWAFTSFDPVAGPNPAADPSAATAVGAGPGTGWVPVSDAPAPTPAPASAPAPAADPTPAPAADPTPGPAPTPAPAPQPAEAPAPWQGAVPSPTPTADASWESPSVTYPTEPRPAPPTPDPWQAAPVQAGPEVAPATPVEPASQSWRRPPLSSLAPSAPTPVAPTPVAPAPSGYTTPAGYEQPPGYVAPAPQGVTSDYITGGPGFIPPGGPASLGGYGQNPTSQHQRRGMVIAVTVAKGGAGKSTLTLNLGVYLALKLHAVGRSVCVVDANFQQADISDLIGHLSPTVVDLARNKADMTPENIRRHMVHIDALRTSFLLGPPTSQMANPQWITPQLYRDSVDVLRELYDYIIIDTPVAEFHHNLFSEFILPTADFIVVPVNPDYRAISNTDRWLRDITQPVHSGGMGFDPQRIGIVLNRAAENIACDIDNVRVELSNWPFLGSIPESKEWQRAANEDEIIATRRVPALDTAFASILYQVTGEPTLIEDVEPAAKSNKLMGKLRSLTGRNRG